MKFHLTQNTQKQYLHEKELEGNMKVKWYLLGCVTSVIIVIVVFILTISSLAQMGSSIKQTPKKVASNSVLYLNLSGPIPEYSTMKDMNFSFLGRSSDSVHDIIHKIIAAKDDNTIRSIILEPQALTIGYANVNEIVHALETFKTSGKKIYGYVSMASQQDMYLLGVADEVYMNPSASAGIFMHGVGGNMDFYKDMLDKLGIQMHIVRAGEYKSAGESFSRNSMSPELRKNIMDIYTDRYNQLVSDFSTRYNTSAETFRYIFEKNDKIFINMEEGKRTEMIDELMFFSDFLKKLNVTDDQLLSYSKYKPAEPKSKTQKIAVVYMLGNIVQSSGSSSPFGNDYTITSKQYTKIFQDIMSDDSIRGVVLRINSGGGSALESEIIHDQIVQLREKKPVIVSMGDVAASGGYYIATNANYIFADPYVITGSIGVIGMIPNLSGTAKKVGINTETVGYGKYLSAMSPFTPFNRNYEVALQRHILDTYDEFKTRVSKGRDINIFEVEKMAQGQIWSAQKALEYRLIDEIGLTYQAVEKAAEIASTSNYSIEYYPTRKSIFDAIMESDFSFASMKTILSGQIPAYVADNFSPLANLIDEVDGDPIQMRSEMVFDLE